MSTCKSIGCLAFVTEGTDFCSSCEEGTVVTEIPEDRLSCCPTEHNTATDTDLTELDVYAIHHHFEIDDPSGCIQEASKKLLMSGVKGDAQRRRDVEKARDLLARWLSLNA